MDADGFTDAYMRLAYGTEATLLTELSDDEATLDQLRQYANTIVDRANATGEALTAGGTIGNISTTDEFYDATMCRRQHVAAGDYLETTATDIAHTQTINNPVLTESYLHWSIPFSIIYKASDQDAFERYYDQYQMIVANSWFTPNFFAAEEYVAIRIGANIMDAKALASTGVSFFSKSGYESQNGVSDNEKYINMWDDVINEVDAYRTLDGEIVKTPYTTRPHTRTRWPNATHTAPMPRRTKMPRP